MNHEASLHMELVLSVSSTYNCVELSAIIIGLKFYTLGFHKTVCDFFKNYFKETQKCIWNWSRRYGMCNKTVGGGGEGVFALSNEPVTEMAGSLPTLGATYKCLKNVYN